MPAPVKEQALRTCCGYFSVGTGIFPVGRGIDSPDEHKGWTGVDAKVRLEGICKSFPGVKALDRADLELRRGEIHALVGENGAGKSTLIKILAGLYRKDSGQIFVGGNETDILNPQHAQALGFGFIHQELAIVPELSIAENMWMGSRMPVGKLRLIGWKKAQG